MERERERELTPVRALRKLREKIKRSLIKSAQGRREAIVVRAPPSGHKAVTDGEAAEAFNAPALARLDHPSNLEYLREYFEFLGSQKLFYCTVCDEEWPVFEKSGRNLASHMRGSWLGSVRRLNGRASRRT